MRGGASVLAGLVLSSALVVGTAGPVHACSIARDPSLSEQVVEQQQFAAADLVFEGTALSIRDPKAGRSTVNSGDTVFWTLSVERVLKGPAGDRREVGTAREGPTCGFPFEVGKRYRVYADTAADGSATTSLFSGTRELVPSTSVTTTPPGTAPPAQPQPGRPRFTG
ncbi:MAG: hypothetical protein ACRD0Q_00075 [Acidimicrobiales bacterium]